jgi:putative flippase GtrA
MNIWRRFVRFNAVGALGIVVQVAAIGVLTAWAGMGYVGATTIAVMTAVVHNFIWHLRWTWRDRLVTAPGTAAAFLRFAMANGAVSLTGNLVVMTGLVAGAGLHPVPANLIAIATCGAANFWLGNRVVFVFTPGEGLAADRPGPRVWPAASQPTPR